MNRAYKNILLPVGLLAGTIIGAGVFALPYIFKNSGPGLGFFYLALGAVIYTYIHLLYADIIVRTPGTHRFVGYAEIYFGRIGFWFATALAVLGLLFGLTIYLVLSASFINLVFPGLAGIYRTMIFWALGTAAIFLNLKKLAATELAITWGMVGIILLIFFLGFGNLGSFDWSWVATGVFGFLSPLAPIFFSLAGFAAIPSLVRYFHTPGVGHNHKLIRYAVLLGTMVPVFVYALFVLGIFGLSGTVTEDAVSGIVGSVSSSVIVIVGILGILSLWSSYIIFGLDLNDILKYDFKLFRPLRLLIVILGPVALYAAGFNNFIELIGFTGGLFLGLEGMLIVFMWHRAKSATTELKPLVRFAHQGLNGAVLAVFAAVLIYEVFEYFF